MLSVAEFFLPMLPLLICRPLDLLFSSLFNACKFFLLKRVFWDILSCFDDAISILKPGTEDRPPVVPYGASAMISSLSLRYYYSYFFLILFELAPNSLVFDVWGVTSAVVSICCRCCYFFPAAIRSAEVRRPGIPVIGRVGPACVRRHSEPLDDWEYWFSF